VYSLRDRRVHQVLDLGPSEPRRHLSQFLCCHVGRPRDLVQVELEDVAAAVDVWVRDVNLLVEAARAHRRWVQTFLVVGGPDDQNVLVLLEAVHLCQHLVDRRAARAVLRAPTATPTQQAVHFVNEHDAW
jgi:hypothetical protein